MSEKISDVVKPCVFLVGAGPGDPELLTCKAARLIRQADVVIIDRLVSQGVKDLIPDSARVIYVGKTPGKNCVQQEEINDIILYSARSGQVVVRLKGGDPYIYGRGSEETEILRQEGIPFQVIPGICSASGGGAIFGIPLTHRGLATGIRFVTGHRLQNNPLNLDWRGLADPDTTLVIYMGLSNIGIIAQNLMKEGLPEEYPVAAIENATLENQRLHVTTLAMVSDDMIRLEFISPTTFIIGRVVSLVGKSP